MDIYRELGPKIRPAIEYAGKTPTNIAMPLAAIAFFAAVIVGILAWVIK